MINQIKLTKIIIAPLDWGLGHATRCIPLIKHLISLNCEVTIAASTAAKILLQAEFPQLNFLDLNAYNIVYARKKRWMPFKILIQIPKIIKAVKLENKWLQNLLITQDFDAVISDNRYGFYSKKIFSVLITHQLQVNTSLSLAKNMMRRLIYGHINRFNECWIPDLQKRLNIAGKLSHPKKFPQIPVKYLGVLSRFTPGKSQKIIYKYLIIISGPEPQRTIFEQKIFQFIKTSKEQFIIVRGKPEEKSALKNSFNCKIYNHLNTKDLVDFFYTSEFIISRCGYTSVMEILALQKKSILIPTPGQTEQEYLSKHLMKQNWCYTFSQNEDFNSHLSKAESFKYALPDINTKQYEIILKDFISNIS